MKIKLKLTLSVGLLFALITVLILISTWNIYALKKDTENILVANYKTLEYANNMLLAIDNFQDSEQVTIFFDNLKKQQENITESGEQEVTEKLKHYFLLVKNNPKDRAYNFQLRKQVIELMRLNMDAIQRKSSVAESTAKNAIVWVSVAGTFCFIIAFTLLVNLPGYIADPIRELTESIGQIADQNYKQRVHFEGNSEFGQLAKSFNTMAQKLEEYADSKLDKIIQGKKRIETLINNLNDPVIGIDEKNQVLFANSEFVKITGLNQEKMVGMHIHDLAVYNDLVRDLVRDIIHPGYSDKTDDIVNQPLKIFLDGKENYFLKEIIKINIVPTGEQETKFIGYFIFLRNITPFKELDQAKTNFIATVSHEFKTPIASMLMSLNLLENTKLGTLNPEQVQLVASMRGDAERLLNITGELLSLTQLESGKISLNVTIFNPIEAVNEVLASVQTLAEQKGISVLIKDPGQIGLVKADKDKIIWVLTNLLTNAIRFSYEGSQIEISLKKQEKTVLIAVKDSGEGIAPQYIDKLFNRYFRVPGNEHSGTGLGLAISKELMEAQDGKIFVESELGIGSIFTIQLNCM